MKQLILNSLKSSLLLMFFAPFASNAQMGKVSNLRPYDKSGINVFETPKQNDKTEFDGLQVRFGAGFTQSFQNLKHENKATIPTNELYKMTPGFNTANANLFMDVQLADGIRLNLTSYLSSRHHNETWVKGGYIQFDKLPFKGQFWDNLMEIATIKVGHMEINYGDAHFKRSDGGQTIQNPFVENYILDAFTTEIGGEVYLQKNGLIGMLGVSNGMIKGNIDEQAPTAKDDNIKKTPSIYLKGGFDKQVSDLVRLRLTGSYYHNGSSGGNTLYGGDRTGSNYFMAMEKVGSTAMANAFSGRLNPGFSKKIDAVQLNAFAKISGLELTGNYENASGRSKSETDNRKVSQIAVDGVYRFGSDENLFVGVRYNTVTARLAGTTSDIEMNRLSAGAGWFLTKNILLKGEIASQKYLDFAQTDYRYGGKFNGYVIQAVVGF